MGGEDFSYYLNKVPGCFIRIGSLKPGFENTPSHSPYYDFDENVLAIAATYFSRLAETALNRINELRQSLKTINT